MQKYEELWEWQNLFLFFYFFEGEGCQFGAGTHGGGESFLIGLLLGEGVGGVGVNGTDCSI